MSKGGLLDLSAGMSRAAAAAVAQADRTLSKTLRGLFGTGYELATRRGWVREHTVLGWNRRQAKRVLGWSHRQLRRALWTSAAVQWGTKSFEFWTLLMAMLAVARPKSVVEFGSGRSTSYLAEYAMKEHVPYVSMEQNRNYARRIKRGLSNSFLDPSYLFHVPIAEDGWYDVAAVNCALNPGCELLFIDGPVGVQDGMGKAVRRSERADKWLAAAVRTSKILIVDDVHRRTNLKMFQTLMSASEYLRPMFVSYPVPSWPDPRATQKKPNVAAIGISSCCYERIVNICSQAKIEFSNDYSIEECSEP